MSEQAALLRSGETWLLEQWLEKFTGVMEAMVDDHPSLTWTTEGSDDLGPNPLLLEQKLASSTNPLIWIGVPEATWRDIGGRILLAAGVETVSDEESRNTCLEILEQSIGGLAQTLTERLQREIVRSGTNQPDAFPNGVTAIRVTIQYGSTSFAPLWISFAPLLDTWLEEEISEPSSVQANSEASPEIRDSVATVSKTFDLLLDVALPVSVSFGRTELVVKEVLKLTTGSIVELNRAVSEPVEVIVNNCVIARGEVVVVDGNYGVRIHQIVSRQERLRTGSATGAALRAPRANSGGGGQVPLP